MGIKIPPGACLNSIYIAGLPPLLVFLVQEVHAGAGKLTSHLFSGRDAAVPLGTTL